MAKAKGDSEEDFMELAHNLREVLESRPDDFLSEAKRLGVARRKAYYLVEIDRAFGDLDVDRELLNRVGWTKLNVLAGKVNRRNAGHLLKEAERLSAYELERLVYEGTSAPSRPNVVMLRLTDEEYQLFRSTVRAFGAQDSPTGLSGKENALIAALKKVRK